MELLILIVIIVFLLSGISALAGDRKEELNEYIEAVCEVRNLCPELVQAIIEQESRYNSKATNGPCKGLMQINEQWHQERMERHGVTDLMDPYSNILIGVDYLAELFERYEDVGAVLMVYNGDSRAAAYMSGQAELSAYAKSVLERSAELERQHGK